MSTVLFSYSGEAVNKNSNLPGRTELFNKLRELAIEPVIALHAEEAFKDDGVHVRRLASEDETSELGVRAISNIATIVNRKNRSFDFKKMSKGYEGNMPPMLNENALRSLVHRKHRVWQEVFKPLSMGIPTKLVESRGDLDDFIDEQGADSYILKPWNGTNGKGINKYSRNALKSALDDVTDGKHIIQPAYDFSYPFPKGLRAYDAASQEAFEGWSTSDAAKELRVYTFRAPGYDVVLPVGRAIKDGKDNWFFVDPDTAPFSVMEAASAAVAKAAEISGSSAALATVDSGYGQINHEDPAFHAIELNGKGPYMIGYDKHPQVADELRDMLSLQLKAVIDGEISVT